jgi:hypothetical protein
MRENDKRQLGSTGRVDLVNESPSGMFIAAQVGSACGNP